MHQYTNMADSEDIIGFTPGFNDIEVPIKPCPGKEQAWRSDNLKYYCTDFQDEHYIHGGFSADKFSWMRLVLHQCDPSKQSYCNDPDTSRKYFERTIVGIQSISQEFSIDDEFSRMLYKAESNLT